MYNSKFYTYIVNSYLLFYRTQQSITNTEY